MSSEPTLRQATNQDGPAVRRLVFAVLREYGLEPDPERTDADLLDIERSYLDRGGTFDVLEAPDGRIVGSVGLYRIDDETVELRKMYLAAELRGRGLGRALLEHALRQARAAGCRQVVLETAAVLREAIALYRRYGFVPSPGHGCSSRCDQAFVLDLRPGPLNPVGR